jgi:hypothetical protein
VQSSAPAYAREQHTDYRPPWSGRDSRQFLSGARDEFHLAAIVQNLKTMARGLLGPPPEPAPA